MTGPQIGKLFTGADGEPSRAELEAENASLRRRLAESEEALRLAAGRFERALAGSPICLFEQDESFHYTWICNPPPGLQIEGLVGQTEAAFLPPPVVEKLQAFKGYALASGEARRAEIHVGLGEGEGWFDVHVQPQVLADGRRGLIAAAMDISVQKQQQVRLQEVMRELNHRSKNLLTIVQSIARQTALSAEGPDAFLVRFNERLQALANAHDVLVRGDWRGADLRQVIEAQLNHHHQGSDGRIRLDGEAFELSPGVAHYLGLAMHELGSNAAKYGALSDGDGRVEIVWAVRADDDGASKLHLTWTESGGPDVVATDRRGFGRTILESLVPRAMRGEARLSFDQAGVVWSLTAPLAS